jgi:hypothetical protein
MKEGQITYVHDVGDGLEKDPEALIGLFTSLTTTMASSWSPSPRSRDNNLGIGT